MLLTTVVPSTTTFMLPGTYQEPFITLSRAVCAVLTEVDPPPHATHTKLVTKIENEIKNLFILDWVCNRIKTRDYYNWDHLANDYQFKAVACFGLFLDRRNRLRRLV